MHTKPRIMTKTSNDQTASIAVKRSTGTAGLRRVRDARGAAGAPTIGKLIGVSAAGDVLVVLDGADQPVTALSTVALSGREIGRDVLVSITAGPRATAVVTGVLRRSGDAAAPTGDTVDLTVDRKRIVIQAETELVLRCGKASLLLTQDGKVVIKGASVLSAAAGLHRIRGGAVQIN